MKVLSLLSLAASTRAFSPSFVTRSYARTATALNGSTGTVKWFNTIKGFGFIVPDDGSSDVFVHQTDIRTEGFRSLADGEAVEFDIVTDDNGRRKATAVTGPGGADVMGAPFRPRDDEGY
mmetsp:Transcript_10350/g.15370  ORF Transcript_10350/g.15370 Transcript_10350/m.15370 type:complete len:120 (-) Transcript_10350:422-781(-)|eukprot:CAMPEP_0196810944 /NCGR_PEP_ID=MMETSP1362-20130617/15676_1 /TAXON_ID=163516 /ORGANISM="Leptocylindrus danicus, Strain CCMP1856" /LENGTH=119 /DNA_ID=CAMNT_0042186143 /DNA_START=52 /DNA_END=411 /DNA_ORIENTATION=+